MSIYLVYGLFHYTKNFAVHYPVCVCMWPYTYSFGGGLVTKSYLTLVIPWTVDCQAPLSVRFPRQEYWSGLPFPSPGNLPNPGIELKPPAMQETWDMGSIPGSGRYPGGGHGNPLQFSCLENPMDRGAWQSTVHGVTKELDTHDLATKEQQK